MIIIHADGSATHNLENGGRVTIGFTDDRVVFNTGATQAVITHIEDELCEVEAFGMNVKINDARVRTGMKVELSPGDLLKIGTHRIKIQAIDFRDLSGSYSLPGADPRIESPPTGSAEPTYSSEAFENSTIVPLPERLEQEDDPPTERVEEPRIAEASAEVPWEEIAPIELVGTLKMMERDMHAGLKRAFARQARKLHKVSEAMVDTVGIATEAMREELDRTASYNRLIATASTLTIAVALIVGYKSLTRVETHEVLVEPQAVQVTVRDLRESEQEPFVQPPTRAIVRLERITVREPEVAPTPTIELAEVILTEQTEVEETFVTALSIAPIAMIYDNAPSTRYFENLNTDPPRPQLDPIPIDADLECPGSTCSFWYRNYEQQVATVWEGEGVRIGACTIGPCLTTIDGTPVPKSCLESRSSKCPNLRLIARLE